MGACVGAELRSKSHCEGNGSRVQSRKMQTSQRTRVNQVARLPVLRLRQEVTTNALLLCHLGTKMVRGKGAKIT